MSEGITGRARRAGTGGAITQGRLSLWLLATLWLLGSSSAWATLGGAPGWAPQGAPTAVVPGQVMKQAQGYTVQQTTTAAGTAVREYVAPDGIVFGVAWRGPRPPDLSALMGGYYATYQSEAARDRGPHSLHYRSIQTSGLVVETGGHMRDLWGRAYVPALLPAGVSEEDIK